MQRIWVVSKEIHDQPASLPFSRLAELSVVPDLGQLKSQLAEGERPMILTSLATLEKISQEIPNALATGLLPQKISPERLSFVIRSILQEAKIRHDLEAAESVAWSGVGSGKFDDPSIEFLGNSILDLSAARDMAAVEKALLAACERIHPTREVLVLIYPETADSRVMGLYQLAVPLHFQDELKAHIYVRFDQKPDQSTTEKIGEALLNLSDAAALAIDRNQMLLKTEETKAVWEASFDSVEDPVVILDENFLSVRANRAYSVLCGIPLSKIHGKETFMIAKEELQKNCAASFERDQEHEGKYFRIYFDPILEPLGAGRYVLRFHDITQERSLTEKILAKEQVAELGILVGSVAHEINNPIGGVLAMGQLMLKDLEKSTSLYDDIENIVHSAERCRRIIQTMLSLVRKSGEEKQLVDLGDCVQSSLELLGSEAKRLQVKLQINVSKNDKKNLLGNRNRLLQVFFHLLQQSLLAIADKKSKQGFDALLRVELIPGFENIEIRIEDNGDPVKHEYEIQSSVAFNVSRMILDEHDAQYFFSRVDGKNQQRIIFLGSPGISS